MSALLSIDCMNSYGLSLSELNYAIRNFFQLPNKLKPALSSYYLLSWEPTYLFSRLDNRTPEEGIFLYHQGINYKVVFTKSRDKIKSQANCWLSFRAAKSEFNTPPYVLVS